MAATWDAQRAHVDAERFADVADDLRVQQREARWWRDASFAYWQSVNGLPLPEGAAPPAHTLAHYRPLAFPEAPGLCTLCTITRHLRSSDGRRVGQGVARSCKH